MHNATQTEKREGTNSRVDKSNGLLSDGQASIVDHGEDGSNHWSGGRCTVDKEELPSDLMLHFSKESFQERKQNALRPRSWP